MTYTQQGERVTLDMTRDEYDRLLYTLGWTAGAAMALGNIERFRACLQLTNELNNGNPEFTPYEIPEEFAR